MFGRMTRAALSVGALVLAVTTVPVMGATPAAAVEGCGGNLVRVLALRMPDDTRIGELQIFFNPDTGYNCAEMHHGGPTWGVHRDTWVYIAKCETTAPTGNCVVVADDQCRERGVLGGAGQGAGGRPLHQGQRLDLLAGRAAQGATAADVLCGT